MIPYLLLLFSSVPILFYLETNKQNSENYNQYLKTYFLTLALVMVFLGGMRSFSVGADTSTYLEYFLSDFYYKIEIGYISLSRLISMLGFNFRVLLIVIQSVVVLPILYIIYRTSKIKWLSLFLYQAFYLYLNSFNIMRQSIAMTVVLVAVYLLFELNKGMKRNLLFLGTILIATLFHSSALAFLILLPLKEYRPKVIHLVVILIGSILIMVFREEILTYIFALINRTYYTDFGFDIGLSTVVILNMFLLFTLTDDKEISKSSISKFMNNLLVGTLFFNLVWAWFPNHARITMYVFLIISIYYPNVLIEQKGSKHYYLKLTVIAIVMLGLYLFQMGFRDYAQVIPYGFL